ncbi:DUF779 domain-containing protein [Xylophilus sp. GOD-11R]|uniref:DUF779 domain-containing protein n=1 Tax=Xylophilus sp. GOD-11R TaxID=3089814 RepID=UPI00298C6B41|nr:DUF779 domain-containing protein [Xylophilus sp. GOD-11R]WPB57513.1 DUF779 domain-containing protein [Xylophilus sp. GOD-11R]
MPLPMQPPIRTTVRPTMSVRMPAIGCHPPRLDGPPSDGDERVFATDAARRLIATLQMEHGPLMFHQAGSGGQAGMPLCFAQGDFPLVEMDVLLGEVEGSPFYVSHGQFRRLNQLRLELDAVPGPAGVFSLERPTGLRFAISFRDTCPVIARRASALQHAAA